VRNKYHKDPKKQRQDAFRGLRNAAASPRKFLRPIPRLWPTFCDILVFMVRHGWQDDIIEKLPSGVDVAQIDEWLRLSPTERLERMGEFLESIERARSSDGHELPEAS
jgi:hypothetical protein